MRAKMSMSKGSSKMVNAGYKSTTMTPHAPHLPQPKRPSTQHCTNTRSLTGRPTSICPLAQSPARGTSALPCPPTMLMNQLPTRSLATQHPGQTSHVCPPRSSNLVQTGTPTGRASPIPTPCLLANPVTPLQPVCTTPKHTVASSKLDVAPCAHTPISHTKRPVPVTTPPQVPAECAPTAIVHSGAGPEPV
jgi:hypothetical protein